jgi:predicted NBD/HSP70 family sugar kinase
MSHRPVTDTPPPRQSREHLRPRGSNQVGVGQFNERVVLQAIRLHGPLAKAEIARLTHLTAQTVSLIIARLEAADLVLKRDPVRGRVGQPSVPIALNPDGAFAIGIKVGRRSLDVLLVDFTGVVRRRWSLDYRYPEPGQLLAEIARRFEELTRVLSAAHFERVQGVGIAAPLSLGGWRTLLEMPPDVAAGWSETDLEAEVARLTDLPVTLLKDTAAACIAELAAGRGRSVRSFLYVFVDTFIGGGLVLDSQLRAGLHGNAGAIGSMPLGLATPGAAPAQMLSVASLLNLEQLYAAAGLDTSAAGDGRSMHGAWRSHTERWLAQAGEAAALAVNNTACLLDIESVIVDGSFSQALRAALVAAIERAMDHYDWEGVTRPRVLPGTIGSDARAVGAAMLPLHANFAPNRELFLKAGPDAEASA